MKTAECVSEYFPLLYVPYEMVERGRQVAMLKHKEGDWYVIHRWMDVPREFGEETVVHQSEVCGLASLTDIRTLRAARRITEDFKRAQL